MKGHRFPPLLPVEVLLSGRTLVIAPHADDEVIGCGGTLALARRAGIEAEVVHLTDGADGDPEGRFGDIVAVRREEARASLEVLGLAPARELAFRDGTLAQELDRLVAALSSVFSSTRPRHVIAPSPFEAHPDHRTASEATRRALGDTQLEDDATLFLYGVNAPVPANALIDITPVEAIKDRAMACYGSQIAYSDIRAKVRAIDAARTVNIDIATVSLCEAFLRIPVERAGEIFTLAEGLDRATF